MDDYSAISSRCSVYAQVDDFSGEAMTNPMVPEEFTHVTGGKVVFKRHVVVGTGCSVLPNVVLGEGASVGAMSLVTKNLDAWGVYIGKPACIKVGERSQKLLELEKLFLNRNQP
jgi:galactoside O-acetyltransferase